LIQYGNPDEIDSHASEGGTVAYERWVYLREKRYEFVFADLKGDGRYVLIHSDREDEVHNDDWWRLIARL
jgi:hypothetical protein